MNIMIQEKTMKKMGVNDSLYVVFLLAAAALAAFSCLYDPWWDFTNADALYLPAVFRDLFQQGGSLTDWYLTPAPYFFPDYGLFALAFVVGKTPIQWLALFAFIQMVAIFLAFWYLARQILKQGAIPCAVTVTLILIYYASTGTDGYLYLWISAHHFGAFVVELVLLALWLEQNGAEPARRKSLLVIIALISLLLAPSDASFYVYFALPLLATVLLVGVFQRNLNMARLAVAFIPLSAGLLGTLCYHFLTPFPVGDDYISLGASGILTSIHILLSKGQKLFADLPTVLVFFLLWVGLVVLAARRLLQSRQEALGTLHSLSLFSFLALLAGVGGMLVIVSVNLRYMIPSLCLPVLIVNLYFWQRRPTAAAWTNLALSVLIVGFLSYQLVFTTDRKSIDYYPEEIACIDQVLAETGAQHGIAYLWDAKYTEIFSKRPITLAQFKPVLSESRWINTRRVFRDSYDFALVNRRPIAPMINYDANEVLRINGQPPIRKLCGNIEVWVYGKDRLQVGHP